MTTYRRPRSIDHQARVAAIRRHCEGDRALEFFLVRVVLEGMRNSSEHVDPERRGSTSAPHNTEWYEFIGKSANHCEPHERYQASLDHALQVIGGDPADRLDEVAKQYVTAFRPGAIKAGRDYIESVIGVSLTGKPKRFKDVTRDKRSAAYRKLQNKLVTEEVRLLNEQAAACPLIWLSDLEVCRQMAHERGWISTIEELEYLYSHPHILVRGSQNKLSFRPLPEINLPKLIREQAWGPRYHYVDFSKSKVQFALETALQLKLIDSDEHTLLWHCIEFFPLLVENVQAELKRRLVPGVDVGWAQAMHDTTAEAIKTLWNASFDGGAVAGWNTVRVRGMQTLYDSLRTSTFVCDLVILLNRVRSRFGKEAWSEYERWERGHRLALIKAARMRGVYCNTINDGLYFVSDDAAALSLLKSDIDGLAAERRLLLKGRWQMDELDRMVDELTRG